MASFQFRFKEIKQLVPLEEPLVGLVFQIEIDDLLREDIIPRL